MKGLKELRAELSTLAEETRADMAANPDKYDLNSGVVTRYSFAKDGQWYNRYRCQDCGTEAIVKMDRSYDRRNHYYCDCCHRKARVIIADSKSAASREIFVRETECGAFGIEVVADFSIQSESADPDDWMSVKPVISPHLTSALLYEEGIGTVARKCGKDLRAGTNEWGRTLFLFRREFEEKGGKLEEISKKLEGRKNPARISTQRESALLRLNYKPKKSVKVPNVGMPFIACLVAQSSKEATYHFKCLHCGHEFNELLGEEEFHVYAGSNSYGGLKRLHICPNCGAKYDGIAIGRSERRSFVIIESTDLPEKDLLIRRFSVEDYFDSSDGKINTVRDVREDVRWFVSVKNGRPKSTIITASERGEWSFSTIRELPYYQMYGISHGETDNSPEALQELVSDVKGSSLRASGLIEYWGLNPDYTGCAEPGDLTYLLAFVKNPSVELLAKGNCPSIARDLVLNIKSGHAMAMSLPSDAKTLTEFLGISKRALKVARLKGWILEKARRFDLFLEADPSLTEDDIDFVMRMYRWNTCLSVIKDRGVSMKALRQYLENVHDYQCIDEEEAITIWDDYLRMAMACGFDLNDKSRKYPTSLKKEHDIAIFAYNKVKNQIADEEFRRQSAINKRDLEYSFGELFVKVPETQQDVIAEATAQKNCLRSYLDRIAEGKTRVAFIRKKKDPETSYITVEVSKEGRLVQVKGYCNSNPRNAEVDEFLRKWCRANNLYYA